MDTLRLHVPTMCMQEDQVITIKISEFLTEPKTQSVKLSKPGWMVTQIRAHTEELTWSAGLKTFLVLGQSILS